MHQVESAIGAKKERENNRDRTKLLQYISRTATDNNGNNNKEKSVR